MFWNVFILILVFVSALYALPYGRWEYLSHNKIGGIIVYVIATLGIALSIVQLIV